MLGDGRFNGVAKLTNQTKGGEGRFDEARRCFSRMSQPHLGSRAGFLLAALSMLLIPLRPHVADIFRGGERIRTDVHWALGILCKCRLWVSSRCHLELNTRAVLGFEVGHHPNKQQHRR
jgi:hypothetical protein